MSYTKEQLKYEKVINPTIDEGFKLIFGREDVSEPLLLSLLNSIFANDPDFGDITKLRFIQTEHPNEYIHGRGLRYDIRCETASGHRFIVEMQKADQENFIARSQYYVSRDIASQGYKGKDDRNKQWDFSLVPVIGVFFCNFMISELDRKPVTYARILDEENHQTIGEYQRYVYIQLPCFVKEKVECDSFIDKWIYNIKNMGTMQSVAFKTQDEIFEYLDNVSNVATLPPEERGVYEAALMRARDYNAQMKFARKKAMAEGHAEGRAEGAKLEKISLVKSFAAQGVDLNIIAKATGLSIEKIHEIINDNH